MYKRILVPIDNSDYSNRGIDLAIDFAKKFDARLVGIHVYTAQLHGVRFKQMEVTLPAEYQEEKELEKQRNIHGSLISQGLTIITDSYLDQFESRCQKMDVDFERIAVEGKNFQALVDEIQTGEYDLVIIGALGLGTVKDSLIGSVCERVVRRIKTDVLVIKNLLPFKAGKIVVAIDGSAQAFGGLKTALALSKAFNVEVEAISAFDPFFHSTVFSQIAGVLSKEAGETFKFEEQETLHEKIIDSGLAKIYQSHLDTSSEIAYEAGVKLKTTLFAGKAFEQILKYVREEEPWLLVVGRIGIHSADDMDIGSNTENLLRLAPCHLLISSSK